MSDNLANGDQTSTGVDDSGFSRRRFLKIGAAGAAAAGAAAASGLAVPGLAFAAGPSRTFGGGSPLAHRLLPRGPVPPNTVSNVVGVSDWVAYNGTKTFAPTGNSSEVYVALATANGYMAASLNIPPGGALHSLAAYGRNSAGQEWGLFDHDIAGDTIATVALVSQPTPGYQFTNIGPFTGGPHVVLPYHRLEIAAQQSTDANNTVAGVGYYYYPPIPNNVFTAVSTQQYQLANNNGQQWTFMDGTNLGLTVTTPAVKTKAIVSANADLWTNKAGYNQDIGVAVSGGAYPTVALEPEFWKESGGFAGTFSPNAAYAEGVLVLDPNTTYTFDIVWKTNKPAAGVTIFAGAGPIGPNYSPTRLTVTLFPSD